jgi:ABC-2 type transport system ATP-binding protein
MIEAIQLSKRYEDGILALDSLDLVVAPGQVCCLLGANGAGKTTTINLFLNFLEPSSGRAVLDGIDVHARPLEALSRVAYLSENVTLYVNFTARQNLDFFARLGGREPLSREEARQVLARVGLPEKAFEQRVKSFSKGMRQKLGIAIAEVKNAPALLLDEPTSGLDPKAAAELVRTLKGLRDDGRAILMSTHDIFRAKELADLLVILREGRKVFESGRAGFERENLEELYLYCMRGEPAAAPAGDRAPDGFSPPVVASTL